MKVKRPKKSKFQGKQTNKIVKKSRKELRKEERKQKKARKNEYYVNKNKAGRFVLKPPSDDEEPEEKVQEITSKSPKNNQNKKMFFADDKSATVAREKREAENLKMQMKEQRKKQLLEANVEEDKNIKRLEKQLKLNKRKTKSVPKFFSEDGLDYLLEVCDSENMESIISAEQQLNEVNDEFEEDFALMTNKKQKNDVGKVKKEKIKSKVTLEDKEFEAFLNGDVGSEDDINDSEDNDECQDDNNSVDNAASEDDVTDGEDNDEFQDIFDGDNENEDCESEELDDEESGVEIAGNKEKHVNNTNRQDDESEEDNFTNDELNTSEDEVEEIRNNKKRGNNKNTESKKKKLKVEDDLNKQEEADMVANEFKNYDNCKDDYEECRDNNAETSTKKNMKKKKDGTWEDIYGRMRDKDGNVITKSEGKYIPPAVRARMEGSMSEDKIRIEKLSRLKRQLKGYLNRLAESNMHSIANQIEDLYMSNSRNDMNDTLTNLILEATATNVLAPERLLLEHILLVAILQANVGTEVGAHFLQCLVNKFDELFNKNLPVEDKTLNNTINLIAQLYNFKVFHSQLLYQILSRLSTKFEETHVECILAVLKAVGFTLRKDDPIALKTLILDLQKQANNATNEMKDNARVKFMLDVLLAIKNNNMHKIPNYDTSYSEHLKKILKGFIRKGNYITQLNIGLDDLLKADERGKWWVVGSAWTGKIGEEAEKVNTKVKSDGFSQKLLELARKQRMNTDTRRNIFCIIMSAEDYLDAFENILRLGLKNQQEREIIHVLLHCCLQDKKYNPYYSVLAQKFCDYDRKFQMTIKYSVWDKLKGLTECSAMQISNLAKLLTHLFLEKGLSISTLKVVQFSELDKLTLRFTRQILLGVLLCEDAEQCQEVFEKVGRSEKLKMFRESLRLFIHHFLLKNLNADSVDDDKRNLLQERVKMVEKILTASDRRKL